MARNKYLIIIIACVTLLAAATAPRAANAADYTPEPTFPPVTSLPNAPYVTNLAVELDSYGYPVVSWSPIYGYTYDVFRSSNNNVSTFYYVATVENSWYTDLNVSSSGTLYYRIRVRQGDAAGRLSSSVSITMTSPPLPTPAPTPVPTPDPFTSYPPIPDFSAVPLPTPAPSFSIYNIAYNYYTVNDRGFYNRNGEVFASPPSFINLGLVSSNVSLPVHFSFSNSQTNPNGYSLDNHYIVSVLVDVGSYTVGDVLNFSYSFDDLRALYSIVSTDPADIIAEPSVAFTVWDYSANRVFWSAPSPIPFSQFVSGYSNSITLDYEGITDLEFELLIIPSVNPDFRAPMYLDGSSVSFSLWSSLIDVTDPSIPIVDAVNSQTTFVGRFFSWLWDSLKSVFVWLSRFIIDGFDFIGIRLDVLINRLSVWFSDTMATIRTAASDVIDFTGRLFIPSADDFTNAIARIRNTIEPEEGSLLAFPHQIELELFTILSRDYSTEPEPLTLQEFQINIRGQNYTIFPRTEIRLSTIFPYDLHRYVRFFGDLTLGVWVLYLITNKVRKLLNLWYSED